MLINLVIGPAASFMPLLVTEHFNGTAWHLGLLEAAFGIGILGGGLLLGLWGGFHRRIYTSLMGVMGIGLGFLVMGFTPATMFALAVMGALLTGIMSSLTNGPIMAIFQSTVEPSMQGRVFTLVGSASAGMMPIGLALAGPLAEVVGVRTWFFLGGTVTLALGVLCFFLPALVNIERDRDDFPDVVVEAQESPTLP
jgi:DHA3 family macrolide efflux protein-like MFS transporter